VILMFLVLTLAAVVAVVLWVPMWLLLDGGQRSARPVRIAPRPARRSASLFVPRTPRLQ